MLHNRKIFPRLINNLKNNKIIILTGSRQVGKTTIMKMIYEQAAEKSKAAFIDMDLTANRDIGERLENFLDFLRLNGYSEKLKKFYVFIDEFHRIPEMTIILKNIYDHYPNIKIFASGSSSLSIKKNKKESLAGRKFVFEIYPLDFEEFLDFKGDEDAKKFFKNIKKLKSENIVFPSRLNKLLEEFYVYGGYPEVVLSKTESEKEKILKSIFDLYVEKDVMLFLGVENIWAYKKIIQILAVDSGNLLNYNNLSKEAGIHNKTVRSYLLMLEDTYLIKILRPFSTNKHNEITKSPKIYFLDNGVRNYFLNNFNKLEKRIDRGSIYESYILQEIIKNKDYNIKFWRTKQREEVDFIIEKNNRLTPIEAKVKSRGKLDDYRHILKFLSVYRREEGFVLNGNFNKTIERHGKKIKFNLGVNFIDKL